MSDQHPYVPGHGWLGHMIDGHNVDPGSHHMALIAHRRLPHHSHQDDEPKPDPRNARTPRLELELFDGAGAPMLRRTWTPRDGVVMLPSPTGAQLRITPLPDATTDDWMATVPGEVHHALHRLLEQMAADSDDGRHSLADTDQYRSTLAAILRGDVSEREVG